MFLFFIPSDFNNHFSIPALVLRKGIFTTALNALFSLDDFAFSGLLRA